MKAFEDLTKRGRVRRLRRLASAALQAYDLDVVRFDLIQDAGNTLYRVRAREDRAPDHGDELFEPGQFLLRLHWPGYRDVSAIRLEMAWLHGLRQDCDLPVPEPLLTAGGELLVEVSAPGVPEARHCSVLRWLKGRRVGVKAIGKHYETQGRLMARMHTFSEGWRRPEGLRPREYDWTGLFKVIPALGLAVEDVWSLLPGAYLRPFQEVASRTRAAMDDLGVETDAYGLIHADLAVDANLLFWRGQPRAIDFDELGLGYWVYDLAVALEHCREQRDYLRYRDTLLGAYSEFRTLPQEQLQYLDLFMAALDVYIGLWANAVSHFHPEYDEVRTRSQRSLRLVAGYLDDHN
jgi:Ser/Thr protein kinase RdoA (MazF antagonist)